MRLIANTIAKLPIITYQHDDPTSESGEGKRHAKQHAAYSLQRWRPTPERPEITAFSWKQTAMGHVLHNGNSYTYIVRDGAARPRELVLLNPDETYPVRVNGTLWYVTKVGSEDVKLPAEDVLHWKGLGWDGLVGYDVLTYAREAIGEGVAKMRYSASFFGNNARAGVIIEAPAKMKEEAKVELAKAWDRMHKGLDNAHRTAILDSGAKINTMTINANDAQLIESRKLSIVDMANVLDLPPHKLGADSRTSYSSLEQENQSYLVDCIDPWLNMIEAEHRAKLLTEEEQDEDLVLIQFNRKLLIQASLTDRGTYYPHGSSGGQGLDDA